jgi:transposase
MHMLADLVELVIGVDTPQAHPYRRGRDRPHRSGARPGNRAGHPIRLPAAAAIGPPTRRPAGAGHRATGGYGAGLTRFLHAHAEQVVELDRPKRVTRRHGAKSDALDVIRAAREALARERLAQPRAAGQRAAFSVRLAARRSAVQATTDAQRQLHALVVAAPDTLREGLGVLGRPAWSPPVGVFDCWRPGTPRPWRPWRVCGLWPAASSS